MIAKPCFVVKLKAILKQPGCLYPLADFRIAFGAIDFSCSFIQPIENLVDFCIGNGIIDRWSLFVKITEEKRIFEDSLNGLEHVRILLHFLYAYWSQVP